VIDLDEQFEVAAPPSTVWRLIADPYAIVGCVPGAAIVGQQDDGSLDTTLTVKFGPLSIGFQAQAKLELDAAAMRGRLVARGKDKQGGARFQASATFDVTDHAAVNECIVTMHGEVDITGRLASMIESGAGAVVKRMSSEFAACLRTRCASAA
jgi:uncharacterized protein